MAVYGLQYPSYTSFDKFQNLRRRIEKCSIAPSEGLLQNGPVCSVITRLDKKHKTNSRQLLAGLKKADEVWQKTFEREHKKQETSPYGQSHVDFVDVSFDWTNLLDRKTFGGYSKGPSYVDPRDKIEAYRAATSVLSEVLQKEITWMQEACCVMEAAMVRMPGEGGESKKYLSQLQALVGHYRPIITESKRLIDAEVND
jgi:hypothetical protein